MEAIFKNYFWVIQVLGVAAATGLGASAVMTQIGTRYALDVGAAGDKDDEKGEGEDEEAEDKKGLKFGDNPFQKNRRKTTSTLVSAKNKTGDDIRERNIFCPTCVPVPEATGNVPLDADGRPVGIQPGEVKSSLPFKLMATMEATDPKYSLATVYDAEEGVTGLYGLGDDIRPSVVVVGVDAGLLHLRNSARLEYVQLGDDAKVARPATRAEPKDKDKDKDKKKKKNSREIPGAEDAINCPNENTCVVERKFVEKLMGNPALLAKQARIVPSQRDGEVQGFKFYGIRRGSLPKLLGLKNGDMLTEVNGEEIRSVDQAMSLAMKLRRASNLSVTLVRKGKTMNKEIQIQ